MSLDEFTAAEIARGKRAHDKLLQALEAAPLVREELLDRLWRDEDDDPPALTVLDGGQT